MNRPGYLGIWKQKRSRQDALRQCSVFSPLSSGEIDRIAELALDKEYEAGKVIFHAKDKADELFILEEGKIALQMVSPIPPERPVTVDIAFPGELVGWPGLIEPYVYDLTAICLQRSRVLALDAVRLRLLLHDANPACQVMTGVVRCVMSRLSDTRQLLIAERFWQAKSD